MARLILRVSRHTCLIELSVSILECGACVGWGRAGCLSFTFVYKLIKDKNRDVECILRSRPPLLLAKKEWG